MKIKIGIDASRGRSGGAKAHLIGILEVAEPGKFGIQEVHVWCYSKLANQLPKKEWLIIHTHPYFEKNIVFQLYWQYLLLRKELKNYECDGLLSIDAGTVYVHNPSVVMSRDMLSFEHSEINRYKGLKNFIPWLRLYLLRLVQINSLKKANSALFLTEYAAKTIQSWSGAIKNYRIIHHGVGANFKTDRMVNPWPLDDKEPINCLYISNTAMYKHQWHVVKAIHLLRKEGYNVSIEFVGGGCGESKKRLMNAINQFDTKNEFTVVNEFLKHSDLPSKLSSADIFIFASSCENMPNTLVEAMSSGLPIACSNRGPMPEVLRDGGVYFNPEDPESIFSAIKILIEDKELRNIVAENAFIYSQEFSWERCSHETLGLLTETIRNFYRNE